MKKLRGCAGQWGSASVDEKVKAAGQLEGTLSRLLLVAEQYPELKANANFRDLQFELAGTENRIAIERQRYNDTAQPTTRPFANSPEASSPGCRLCSRRRLFEAASNAKVAPKVDFDTEK